MKPKVEEKCYRIVAINVGEFIASVNGCWTILKEEWLEQYFVHLCVVAILVMSHFFISIIFTSTSILLHYHPNKIQKWTAYDGY
jgi:hypothetical protein